jgi:hypothetical protein
MIIFVADAFAEHFIGGAELTTEAIIDDCLLPYKKILSNQVNLSFINQNKDKYFIFANFSGIHEDLLIHIAKNINYSIIEYDYKFCRYRSVKKHENAEGKCDCHEVSKRGKSVAIFFAKSKSNFWMSQKQKEIYLDRFDFLRKVNNIVLSSVFSRDTLRIFKNHKIPEKNKKWLILNSSSWIKGTEDTVRYAQDNKLDYELVGGLSHEQLLKKLAESKGLIFRPLAGDTCPRIVIEAKLMECELILNENVQHKFEIWFLSNKEKMLNFLENRTKTFWTEVAKCMKNTGLKNPEQHYKVIVPFYNVENWISKCIRSLKFQNHENFQCILVDDLSTDNTVDIIKKEIEHDDRFVLLENTDKKFALENVSEAIQFSDAQDQDVIVILDGDDWLTNASVLSRLNEAYNDEECLLTYGSYVAYPSGIPGIEPSQYPEDVINNNLFREDAWRASHLKSFKYKLWQNLNLEDLKDNKGEYYRYAYDQAFMLPFLEMAGERSKYLNDLLYSYNRSNPLNCDKIKAKEQHGCMLDIRSKEKYKRL